MEAKRQDIGMDIDENKKDTQNKTNTQDKADTSNKEDKPDGSEKEEAQKSTSASREILSWDRGSISDQELSDHQRRCTDRLHGKYDHAGGPPDRESSRIFKGYTGARGCCDFPLSG